MSLGDKQFTITFKVWFGYVLAALFFGAGVMFYVTKPPKVETIETVVQGPEKRDTTLPAMGWINDQELIQSFNQQVNTPYFGDTPAGKAVMGDDEDRFLWRAVRKSGKYTGYHYPNINQEYVGCCVGAGWKHGCDVAHGINIQRGHRATFKTVSAEVIYGGSRVEIGGGKLRGDGSTGAWAKEFVLRYGVVAMENYPEVDLSVFSPDRARSFGSKGVPAGIEALAKQFPIKEAAIVKTAAEGIKAIQQDYPIPICSNVGFNNADGTTGSRDKNGFCKARGTWNHCMVVIGYRKAIGGVPAGVFILNSWGDDAHKGSIWPEDAPVAGFWIDIPTFERILKQNDSYAISAVTGFPSRKPTPQDWYSQAEPARRDTEVARRNLVGPVETSYALAP